MGGEVVSEAETAPAKHPIDETVDGLVAIATFRGWVEAVTALHERGPRPASAEAIAFLVAEIDERFPGFSAVPDEAQ